MATIKETSCVNTVAILAAGAAIGYICSTQQPSVGKVLINTTAIGIATLAGSILVGVLGCCKGLELGEKSVKRNPGGGAFELITGPVLLGAVGAIVGGVGAFTLSTAAVVVLNK